MDNIGVAGWPGAVETFEKFQTFQRPLLASLSLMLAAAAGFYLGLRSIMPGETCRILIRFPEEFRTGSVVVSNLVHCFSIKKTSVHHGVADTFCVSDIFKQVFIHNNQIRNFTF